MQAYFHANFLIISQHTQRGLSSLRSKIPFCETGSGAFPPIPQKHQNRKIKIFLFWCYQTRDPMADKELIKRTKEIKIRLTEEEHQALLNRCTKASLATWIRETCLGEKQTKQSKVIEVDPKLLRQLAGIGNNLNQIARLVNQHSKQDSVLDRIAIITALSSIERELQRLNDDHKNT